MKIIAYTDGSFRQGTKDEKIVGYGVSILVDNEDEEYALNGVSTSEHLLSSRNVSGELLAVMALIDTISGVSENPSDIDLHIYYDYEGVEKWVTGKWRANKLLTQEYRDKVRKAIDSGIQVSWHKVKAHSGIAMNERADALAAQAIIDYAKENNIDLC